MFQRVFSGRKAGYLIDFGGGVAPRESFADAAIREFVEETETLYFAEDIKSASRTPDAVSWQMIKLANLFDLTQQRHPEWRCSRGSPEGKPPKDWQTFFIEVPYRGVLELNREWESDTSGRFKKRRELVWIDADTLLVIKRQEPDKLWKRVRELEGFLEVVDAIASTT